MVASIFFLSCFGFVLHDGRRNRVYAPCYVKWAALVPFAWNPFAVNRTWHRTVVTQAQPDVTAFRNTTSHRHRSRGSSAGGWGSTGRWAVGDPLKGSARVSTSHGGVWWKAQEEPVLTSLGLSSWVWYPVETALSQENSFAHSWVWMAVVHVLAVLWGVGSHRNAEQWYGEKNICIILSFPCVWRMEV